MKTTSWIIALAVSGFAFTTALASDKSGEAQKPKTVPAKASSTEPKKKRWDKPVLLTGSYIKQDVQRDGIITDSSNPVYILDRKAIQMSGAADLSQVLFRTGFRR